MILKCNKCKTENRSIAKYCKSCGAKLNVDINILSDSVVGREEIKNSLNNLINSIQTMNKDWNSGHRLNTNMIITGNSGTGKTFLAEFINNLFHENNLTSKKEIFKIDASQFEEQIDKIEEKFKDAKKGILFIDNFDNLIIPNSNGPNRLTERLLFEMEKNPLDPIIIITGSKNKTEEFLQTNSSFKNRFEYYFRLNDFTSGELYTICKNKLSEFGLELSESSAIKLSSLMKFAVKKKDHTFGNAHFAINTAGDIAKAYYKRINDGCKNNNIVNISDITANIPKIKSYNELLAEFDELIGLEKVKAAVREIAGHVQFMKKKKLINPKEEAKIGMHLVLTGNPGTGKTMISRKLGEILSSIDYLDRGHVVEVDKSSMVSQYIGETPQVVQRKCDEAMGGVLFVDEAYALASGGGSSNSVGKEAIETLLKRMEDDRDKFMVVAAGYRKEMELFLNANTGLRSRFDRFIHIDDYKPDELVDIFKFFAKKNNYSVSPKAEMKVREIIEDMYARRDRNFANGREVRRLFEKTLLNLSDRIIKSEVTDVSQFNTILLEDLPFEETKIKNLDEIFSKMNELIGLDSVKSELNKMAAYIKVEAKRKKLKGKSSAIDYHFAFLGNPGTGKTTVARFLGEIFKSLGLLSKGHVVEADRSELVAKYVGQTSDKTNKLIDSAMGGVLFIDEAYSLVVENSSNDFGSQAIQTLLKRMEDDKGKFIVVVAGYPNEMNQFINSNPGLESRFKKQILFGDYNPEELFLIFKKFVNDKGLNLSSSAESKIKSLLDKIYSERDGNFGNARTVRNLFESVLENQSFRIAKLLDSPDLDESILFEIEEEDIAL